MTRQIYEIANEIREDWKEPNFAALPYLAAMQSLGNLSEYYYADTARSVVSYFIANAGTWRGPVARRVKEELKQMLKDHANAR